jgi:hypothetical protein
MHIETIRTSATDEHRSQCSQKLVRLREQLGDLKNCLVELLTRLESGTARFKIYRQMKMYNDAMLNPELYTSCDQYLNPVK